MSIIQTFKHQLILVLFIFTFLFQVYTFPTKRNESDVNEYNVMLYNKRDNTTSSNKTVKHDSTKHRLKKIKTKSKHRHKPKTIHGIPKHWPWPWSTVPAPPTPPNNNGSTTPAQQPPITPSPSPGPPNNNQTNKTPPATTPPPNNENDGTPSSMPPIGDLKPMRYGWDDSGSMFADVWDDKRGGTYQASGDSQGSFKVTWQGVDDIVIGKGWKTGTLDRIVNYNGTFQVNGNGAYLSLYGWSVDECVEYYICENYGIYKPCGPPSITKGSFESDGDTYTICQIPRSSQCIDGSQGFTQFWSVRQTKRSSGTIHFANHVEAWKKVGMNLGTLRFPQQISVEAYAGSSGSAEITVEGAGPVDKNEMGKGLD